jgi:hypothetical protein
VKHIRIIVDTYFAQPISLFKARSYERFQEVKSTPYKAVSHVSRFLCELLFLPTYLPAYLPTYLPTYLLYNPNLTLYYGL